jgi:hypothetical protein
MQGFLLSSDNCFDTLILLSLNINLGLLLLIPSEIYLALPFSKRE